MIMSLLSPQDGTVETPLLEMFYNAHIMTGSVFS